ncbi:hypothetical protein [Roseomonas xinghualingensis]|uniref:hypothetical protein n=1 Tax=Roseomonas xinghualingensis TaxID=2986475 RepID=UPI0021F0CDE4|nr:hypothetical protein [Roseomonas sp. SXEYE001]MCV4209577.1 hypothetical protein [Roseomonas sp. SXEYE001]
MPELLSLLISSFGSEAIAYVASALAGIVSAAVLALLRAGWRSLVARGAQQQADANRTTLGHLADFAGRAANLLNLAVLADPDASEKINQILAQLRDDMAAEAQGSLAKIGSDAAGAERLITRIAAEKLPAQVAAVAAASGQDPQAAVKAAAESLLRAAGLSR